MRMRTASAANTRELQQRHNFAQVRKIIQDQDMWERIPLAFRDFSPLHLEGLVKFAYFAGFISLGEARQLLLLDKTEIKPKLRQWYEEIREQGCWLC